MYLEVRMHNEDVEDPTSMLSSQLAIKATDKILELRKTLDILLRSKEKDRKYYKLQSNKI